MAINPFDLARQLGGVPIGGGESKSADPIELARQLGGVPLSVEATQPEAVAAPPPQKKQQSSLMPWINTPVGFGTRIPYIIANTRPEKVLPSLAAAVREIPQKAKSAFLLGGADSLPESTSQLPPGMTLEELASMRMTPQDFWRSQGINSDEELRRYKEGKQKELKQDIRDADKRIAAATPDDLTVVERGIVGGGASLATNALGVTASVLTKSPGVGLAFAGSVTGLDSYGEARVEGASPQKAAAKASIDAAIEVAFERYGTKPLADILRKTGIGKVTEPDEIKSALVRFAAREIPAEQLTTAAQSLNDVAFGLDQEMSNAQSIGEVLRIQGERQAVTLVSTILAGGAQAGGLAAVEGAMRTVQMRKLEGALRELETRKFANEQERLEAYRSVVLKQATDIAAPTVRELRPEGGQPISPEQYGKTYANKVYGAVGNFIPGNTQFSVEKKETDGKTEFTVKDQSGRQYGQVFENDANANSFAEGLNELSRARAEGIKALEPLSASLRETLTGLGLNDIGLSLGNKVFNRQGETLTSEGMYDPMVRRIFLAVDAIDPTGTLDTEQRRQALRGVLRHETVHALRNLDLWKNSEWKNLERAASTLRRPDNGKTYLENAQELYADQNAVIQVEEAVAELIRDVANRLPSIGGRPRTLSERAINFFDKTKNALTGAGFQTYEDVVRKFESGQVGSRQRDRIRTYRATEEYLASRPQNPVLPERIKSLLSTPQGRQEWRQDAVQSVMDKGEVDPAANPAAANAASINGLRESRSAIELVPQTIEVNGRKFPTRDSEGRLIYSGYEGEEVFGLPTLPTLEGLQRFWEFAGDTKIVDDAGRPLVYMHGTSADIVAFKPKQAASVFMARPPKFAEEFAYLSEDYMVGNFPDFMSDAQVLEVLNEALEKEAGMTPKSYDILTQAREMAAQDIAQGRGIRPEALNAIKDQTKKSASLLYQNAIMKRLPSGPNLMPVYINAKKPWDYENRQHVDAVVKRARENGADVTGTMVQEIRDGNWQTIEGSGDNAPILDAIRELGFDAMYVEEAGYKNLAVFDPAQIKSAIGNNGEFSPLTPSIRESRKSNQNLVDKVVRSFNQDSMRRVALLDYLQNFAAQQRVSDNVPSFETYFDGPDMDIDRGVARYVERFKDKLPRPIMDALALENVMDFETGETINAAADSVRGGHIAQLRRLQEEFLLTPSIRESRRSINSLLKRYGIEPNNIIEAERMFADGMPMYAIHEQGGPPFEITSVEALRNYATDQLLALPTSVLGAKESRNASKDAFESKLIEDNRVPDFKSREKLIDMPIGDFLRLAKYGRYDPKYAETSRLLQAGKKFTSLPFLNVSLDEDGILKVMGHEGRHRAMALEDAGYTSMPVLLRTMDPNPIRWSEQNDPTKMDYVEDWPTAIEAQEGLFRVPMPVAREDSMAPYGGPSVRESRGINVEVAPDPRDAQAVERFNALPEETRAQITEQVAGPVIDSTMKALGIKKYDVEYTLGGFVGGTQPSIIIKFDDDLAYDSMVEASKVLGVLWKQQAVITYDENDTSTGNQSQYVKVMPSRKLSYSEQQQLFKWIYDAYPVASGFTSRDGGLVFGNFTEGKVSNDEFKNEIDNALALLDTDYSVETNSKVFKSDYIEKFSLEGTRYESGEARDETGGDVLRRQREFDSLQRESDDLFAAAVQRFVSRVGDYGVRESRLRKPPSRTRAGGDGRLAKGAKERKPINIRPVQKDATTYAGVHYGNVPKLAALSAKKYGTGLKGAEAKNLRYAKDARIRRRVYFYINKIDTNEPIRPEVGVGSYIYTQVFNNILGPGERMYEIADQVKNQNDFSNEFESLVIKNGFDGYAVPKMGMMVILGADAPVRYEGNVADMRQKGEYDYKKMTALAARESRVRMSVGQGTPIGPQQPGPSTNTSNTAASGALNNGQPTNSMGIPVGPTITSTMPNGTVSIQDARVPPIMSKLMLRVIESATDRLRRGIGLDDLADRIERYYNGYSARLGLVNGIIREAMKKIGFREKEQAMTTFEQYMRERENGRATNAQYIYDNTTEAGRALIDAWNQIAVETGRINTSLVTRDGDPLRVFDSQAGAWRKIGMVKDFFPRTFSQEVMQVMKNPDTDPALYNQLLDALVAGGFAADRDEAKDYILREWFSDEVKQDYFAGVEKGRTDPLPEIFYDYSWDAAVRYMNKWARRTSQVEQFGQQISQFEKDWFDTNIPKVRDDRTQAYLNDIKKIIYENETFDGFSNLMSYLNAIATATQLGNPVSAFQNLLGGTVASAQEFGLKEVGKAYFELVREWKNVQKTGTTLGILNTDVMRILSDHVERDSDKYFSQEQKVSMALAKFANVMLTFGGYNGAENIVRAMTLIAAQGRLNSFLRDANSNLNSKNVRNFMEWAKRQRIDTDALLIEDGQGPETERYLRRAVNVPQGSYKIDMTPVFVDQPIGRFLFKYQKFGTQMNRFFYQNFLKPFADKPSPRNFFRIVSFLGIAVLGGTAMLAFREALGYGDPGPDDEELKKALENKDTSRFFSLMFSRAWQSIMAAGSFGFFGNYAQLAYDWQDQQRVKNPLSPPGFSPLNGIADIINRGIGQRKLTARDLDEVMEANLSAYRAGRRMTLATADGFGSDAREVRRFAAMRDQREIDEYTRRYASEMDIEFKRRTAPGSVVRTPMTPVNREITDALRQGDSARARALIRQATLSVPFNERERVKRSIKASVRNRQPIRIGGSAPSAEQKEQFLKWARRNLPIETYQKIVSADRQYSNAANRAEVGFGGED